jgi:uncharacterized repeat protein (TIGR01451 family)
MARGWITVVLVVSLLSTTTGEGFAQTSRNRKSGGSSLASRLGQLKDAFLGEDDSARESSSHEDDIYATPGNRSASNRNSQQQRSNNRTASLPARNKVLPGDLLPKGIFFDRPNSEAQQRTPDELGDEMFHNPSRRSSTTAGGNENAGSRKSPSTTRQDELQAALDDLLAVEQQQLGTAEEQPAAIEPLPSGKGQTAEVNADTRDFDLRQALINKANGNANGSKTEAMNDLRRELETLEQPNQPSVSTQESLAAPFEQPQAQDAFTSPTQQRIPVQPNHASRSARAGMLTAGGETLLSTKQPVIVSRVEGPRQILVGREATYRVTLENTSDNDGRGLTVQVRVPEWAEVVDVISSSGTVERAEFDGPGVLRWQLQDLAGRSAQSLAVRLVPRSGKPLNLSVEWTQAPVASEAMVEVQEPKLEMKISGPQEVLFNKAQRFQLSLSNPGTGVAENVVIKLIPPGGDESSASSHTVGTLQAGASKEIELELTAREAGELTMKARATATGGLNSEAVHQVICRKPELELDWRGPAEKYAGTEASYYFRVRNTGSATTEAVAMRVKLPQGVKLLSASEGYKLDSQSGEIHWLLPGIAAGEAEFIQICCEVDRAGTNRFDVIAETKSGDLRSEKAIETNVIAVADLKLTVTDPQGPVPVGETAVYEIKIRNRGTTDAQNVGVVGLFSAGIDPNAVEGAQFSVRDGRVSIHPINTLPAGQELILKIRAVATQPGTHVFRAEVSCQDLDIKLAAEETTKFYEDQYRWEDGETAYSNDPATVGTR